MDLLSKRYASPCFFLDGVIQTCRLVEFVDELIRLDGEEKDEQAMWEYYLHRAPFYEGSFQDFKKDIKINEEHKNMSESVLETTIQHSVDILKGFNPEKGGE